jgi:hypothetical protein
LSEYHVSFFVSFCQQSCNEFPTMKYVWMIEYQASNIAVEDTENSTLIEPYINIDSRWINVASTLVQRCYVTLIQRHFSTSIQLSNPTKIQRLFNVDGQLKFNVVQRWCACWGDCENSIIYRFLHSK